MGKVVNATISCNLEYDDKEEHAVEDELAVVYDDSNERNGLNHDARTVLEVEVNEKSETDHDPSTIEE